MTPENPPPKSPPPDQPFGNTPPDDLLRELTAAAFDAGDRGYRDIFLGKDPAAIRRLFTEEAQFCMALEYLAFQEPAPVFSALLEKFGDDEPALRAMLRGYERDKSYHRPGRVHIAGPGPNPADFAAKRKALQDFVARQLKPDDAHPAPPGNGGGSKPHP